MFRAPIIQGVRRISLRNMPRRRFKISHEAFIPAQWPQVKSEFRSAFEAVGGIYGGELGAGRIRTHRQAHRRAAQPTTARSCLPRASIAAIEFPFAGPPDFHRRRTWVTSVPPRVGPSST